MPIPIITGAGIALRGLGRALLKSKNKKSNLAHSTALSGLIQAAKIKKREKKEKSK